jgi:hypothetical protein
VGYLLTIHINQNESELTRVHVGDEGGAVGMGQLGKQHSRLDVDSQWTPSPDQLLTVFQEQAILRLLVF